MHLRKNIDPEWMTLRRFFLLIAMFSSMQLGLIAQHFMPETEPIFLDQVEVDSVWVANKVAFDLQSSHDMQFVAYYNKDRIMTVASRKFGSSSWDRKTLPSKLMWDSHNYVALGIDESGFLHVSGNMHTHPLNYFRSTKPYDIQSLVKVAQMTGTDEESVTYPKFFHHRDGTLLFSYRSGTCGNGNILLNKFNSETGSWTRYLDMPLFEGIEKDDQRAAYHKFVRDSLGNFHFIWMWRWTPLVETSHQICYATSSDLIHWKNGAGQPVSLPFRPDDPALIVDGTPSQGGMHNSRYQICLTSDGRPIVGYVKYDQKGLTQLYLSHFLEGRWISKKISDWNFRWEFVGGGDQMTIGGKFSFIGLTSEGYLVIEWKTETGLQGQYIIDPNNLESLNQEITVTKKYPANIYSRLSDHPEMSVNLQHDKGTGPELNVGYLLKWESMKKSHGKHAPDVIPNGPISPLLLIKYRS